MKKYLTSLIVKKLADINFIKYHAYLSTAKIPEVEPRVLWEKLWTNKDSGGVDGNDTKWYHNPEWSSYQFYAPVDLVAHFWEFIG